MGSDKKKDEIDKLLEEFGDEYKQEFWGYDTAVMSWKRARQKVKDFVKQREQKTRQEVKQKMWKWANRIKDIEEFRKWLSVDIRHDRMAEELKKDFGRKTPEARGESGSQQERNCRSGCSQQTDHDSQNDEGKPEGTAAANSTMIFDVVKGMEPIVLTEKQKQAVRKAGFTIAHNYVMGVLASVFQEKEKEGKKEKVKNDDN